MPLIFIAAGYGLIYLTTAPVVKSLYNLGSMMMVEEVPDFNSGLESIYAIEETPEEETQEDTVSVSEITWPSFGQQYGELSCERIQLSTPVYYGDSNEILRVGTGQFIGSFLPGYGRVILLCSHNTTFFKPLRIVEVGDIFTFKTNYGIYQYEVTHTQVADHQDSNAYDLQKQEEELIMYTCYPFETLATTKTDRLFVYAKKISGPEVVD